MSSYNKYNFIPSPKVPEPKPEQICEVCSGLIETDQMDKSKNNKQDKCICLQQIIEEFHVC